MASTGVLNNVLLPPHTGSIGPYPSEAVKAAFLLEYLYDERPAFLTPLRDDLATHELFARLEYDLIQARKRTQQAAEVKAITHINEYRLLEHLEGSPGGCNPSDPQRKIDMARAATNVLTAEKHFVLAEVDETEARLRLLKDTAELAAVRVSEAEAVVASLVEEFTSENFSPASPPLLTADFSPHPVSHLLEIQKSNLPSTSLQVLRSGPRSPERAEEAELKTALCVRRRKAILEDGSKEGLYSNVDLSGID